MHAARTLLCHAQVLQVLADIKRRFDDSGNGALSWADLIVLAGTTAVEEAAGM